MVQRTPSWIFFRTFLSPQGFSAHRRNYRNTFLDLENFCVGAHGFSVLIETQVNGSPSRVVLFDTGPDSKSIIRNIESMKVDVGVIERVILSHWHGDHNGGLLSLLRYRNERVKEDTGSPIAIDLHPDRPVVRGIAPPPGDKVVCRLPEEPTFDEVKALGASVDLHAKPHLVAGNSVFVSGEIPRITEFEHGLLGGMRWMPMPNPSGSGAWTPESHIMDERYAAVDVLGKGLVIFSACSHAGIVNVITDAVKTFHRPIYMVIGGGLHLGGPELATRIPLSSPEGSAPLPPTSSQCTAAVSLPKLPLKLLSARVACQSALEIAFRSVATLRQTRDYSLLQ